MGVIPGETVKIQNRGPLGFPLEIVIQGYVLTLRKNEAEAVTVREA
jgi:ferrous iron transport protein A